jgi:mannitol-1-phosphate 5-dehydrogenase
MPVSDSQALVFGAGKIARGFIAHLLALSGYAVTFVERSPELVAALRRRGRYLVEIMGAPEKSMVIEGFGVLGCGETEAIAAQVATATVIFVSVGGPNLPGIAAVLAEGLRRRTEPVNVILCENYFQPGQWLRRLIAERLAPAEAQWCANNVGIVETMVLRSVIEPPPDLHSQDPLALKAQDMWELPADKQAFVGAIPDIMGLAPKENFQGGLVRKLFTYNAINAVISYIGRLKGYEVLSDAANDPELEALARQASEEVAPALCREFGFDPEDQRRFAESAIAKYQQREIVDPIERNARDPIRKLGRHDRLVGPACLALEHGVTPAALSTAIAAALRYDCPEDPSAVRLQQTIRDGGLAAALRQVCGIEPESELGKLIAAGYREVAR